MFLASHVVWVLAGVLHVVAAGVLTSAVRLL